MEEIVTEHESSVDPSSPRDFIDVYLNEIKSNGGKDFSGEYRTGPNIFSCHNS